MSGLRVAVRSRCGDNAMGGELQAGLERAGLDSTSGPAGVVVVLLPPEEGADPSPVEPLGDFSIAVLRSRRGLCHRRAWHLLQQGFSDVLVWDEQPAPVDTIVARVRRFADVSGVLDSPLVREHLVGRSPAWRRALRQVIETARFGDGALLVTGDTGTGKELVARLFHTLDARPQKGLLVTLDCTTVVPQLSGSEFFGHERGAFTSAVAARDGAFAIADKGTLFLDEVGELSLMMQAELLRVVQERTYKRVGGNDWRKADFRLVCATHRDLRAEEGRGSFRRDFYHRIAASTVHLPSLRERPDDILPLARHFTAAARSDLADVGFDPAVEDFLFARDYPGNVRELRQLVLRIARRHIGPGPITIGDVPEDDRCRAIRLMDQDWTRGDLETALRRALSLGTRLPELKEKVAEVAIELALHDADGNLQRAALKLGVTDRALQMRRAGRRGTTNGVAETTAGPVTAARPPEP